MRWPQQTNPVKVPPGSGYVAKGSGGIPTEAPPKRSTAKARAAFRPRAEAERPVMTDAEVQVRPRRLPSSSFVDNVIGNDYRSLYATEAQPRTSNEFGWLSRCWHTMEGSCGSTNNPVVTKMPYRPCTDCMLPDVRRAAALARAYQAHAADP